MTRFSRKTSAAAASANTTKYDAHHRVLDKAYGSQADLRRELSDSKAAVAERTEILKVFADCNDPQRAWLLLEDYFEKLSLSRKDFGAHEWWQRLVSARGKKRLEETAILFMRFNRPLPTELQPHANPARFAEIEQAEKDQRLVQQLESWLFPAAPPHLDSPRASIRVACQPKPVGEYSALHGLEVSFFVSRYRTGEKAKTVAEVVDLTARSGYEREFFSFQDWQFIQWLSETHADPEGLWKSLFLSGLELLQWLVRWGDNGRLRMAPGDEPIAFHGHLVQLEPHLDSDAGQLFFTHQLRLPEGGRRPMSEVKFFAGHPALALVGSAFYMLRSAPPDDLLNAWAQQKSLPASKLSHRFLSKLRKTPLSGEVNWDQLCVVHRARPRFTFELVEDVVNLRLAARSEEDGSLWHWDGQEWESEEPRVELSGKPRILDDARLEKAVQWLSGLDWFTPEPRLWVATPAIISWPNWPLPGRAGPIKPITWETRPFTVCSFARSPCVRASSSKAAALTGSPSRRNGRRKVSSSPRPTCSDCKRRPADSSSCPTPAGWNWTPQPCNRPTKRWPTWAWRAWRRCLNGWDWNKGRTWMRRG
jgi:hypothetical protein